MGGPSPDDDDDDGPEGDENDGGENWYAGGERRQVVILRLSPNQCSSLLSLVVESPSKIRIVGLDREIMSCATFFARQLSSLIQPP